MILLDMNMPYGDGFDFIESLKLLELKDKPTIKIVILSASMRKRDLEKAKFLKVNDFIEKPLTKESLTTLLGKLFN